MKKFAFGLLLASTLTFPAMATDALPADLELFSSNGECQSAIVGVRNGVRKLSAINVSGSTVSLVCKLVSDGPNKGKYQIIVG